MPGRKSEEVALTTFGAVIQSYVDQGVLPRNVIALFERPKDADVTTPTRARRTCTNTGGRGRYRTADRWCVNPSPIVQCVRRGVIASWNAQLSGWFVSTLSTDCRAVSTRLGTLLAQRGFDRQAFGRVCGADLALRCQNRTIQLPVEPEPLTPTRGAGDVVQAHGGGAPLGWQIFVEPRRR